MADTIRLNWRKSETHGLEDEPEPRSIRYTLFSTDDHLVEPPDMFERRLPAKLQSEAPRVVETEEGHEVWLFEDTPYYQVGFMAVAGRPKQDYRMEPSRFRELRPGCYRIHDRIKDMDLNGVWASLNFPSGVTGFGAETEINRKDWGLEWNVALETGGLLVGDKVKLTIDAEWVKQ